MRKWLRWDKRLTERGDHLGVTRMYYREAGPTSYMSLEFVGEFMPQGVLRSVSVLNRLAVMWGPGEMTVEGIPDGDRYRVWWLDGGARAVVLCLSPGAPVEGGAQ